MRRDPERRSSPPERPGRLLRRVLPAATETRRDRSRTPWLSRVVSLTGVCLAVWLVWEVRAFGIRVVRAFSLRGTPSVYLVPATPNATGVTATIPTSTAARSGKGRTHTAEPRTEEDGQGWKLTPQWPGDTTAEQLRQQFGFCWGKDVPLDPQTGRPLQDSVRWDSCKGSLPSRESKGGGGYIVVPEPEANLPPSQLPESFWRDKRGELDMLALRVEKERLLRLLADEQRASEAAPEEP